MKATKLLALLFILLAATSMPSAKAPSANGDGGQKPSSGEMARYSTAGHPKAQGLSISFEYPSSWTLAEGKRPNIVQKFRGERRDGMTRMCLILISRLPFIPRMLTYVGLDGALFAPTNLKDLAPPGSKFIKGVPALYDGELGAWVTYSTEVEGASAPARMYMLQHTFLYSGNFIALQCSVTGRSADAALPATFNQHIPIFRKVGETVNIHDKHK